ncbi:MAG TPA: AmmeMemoRadiSam system radical SAM enzyme [Clostridiaceae bacterium]|nr:AmmeMemoRadiSam system radical SAM enzyme [Clostridiaceae bacterium]
MNENFYLGADTINTGYKEARYFEKAGESSVRCFLCPHNCLIKPGAVGICQVRKNIDGILYSLNYGKIASIALDPIEKKPLKMYRQGSMILSAGTFGCNLKCSFCQNWSISQVEPDTVFVPPEVLVEKAEESTKYGNIGIAYTYNEPSIWFEYVLETSKLAKENGLDNVLVTNGFIEKEPLKELIPYIDALNIDVKSFSEDFYKKICKGRLLNVKEIVELAAENCHVEITTLVIPDLNDSLEEIAELSKWISSISNKIPLHLTRFFPNYNMRDINPTPRETILKAKSIASEYLLYVFAGNM